MVYTDNGYTRLSLALYHIGVLNGNVGVVKSFLGEITDESNTGFAFSLLMGGWGLGVIIAPIGEVIEDYRLID